MYILYLYICVQGAHPREGVISLVKHVIGCGEVVYK